MAHANVGHPVYDYSTALPRAVFGAGRQCLSHCGAALNLHKQIILRRPADAKSIGGASPVLKKKGPVLHRARTDWHNIVLSRGEAINH